MSFERPLQHHQPIKWHVAICQPVEFIHEQSQKQPSGDRQSVSRLKSRYKFKYKSVGPWQQLNVSMAKAQAFAHRVVEFAGYAQCVKFFLEKDIEFDRPNDSGWTVLMSVCACGHDDLVGLCMDRTTALDCATTTNRTTVLHLSAMSKNTQVIEALAATPERKQKLQKIMDQANVHGDTALMMACVAKNVRAVELLLEMGASVSIVNSSGLTALMCAARVGNDPRSGAANVEKRMEQSARIVDILLAHKADANVVEKVEGNTALHLAVRSTNSSAVESLLANARDLDIAVRNKAKDTALDLCKRMSGPASVQMEVLLSEKWTQHEKAAAERSAEMEQELLCLALADAAGESTAVVQSRRKKNKTKAKSFTSILSSVSATAQELEDCPSRVMRESPPLETASKETALQLHSARVDESFGDDDGTWQCVATKKSRRKETVNGKTEATPPMHQSKSRPHNSIPTDLTSTKNLQTFLEFTTVPVEQASSDHTGVPVITSTVEKASLASQPASRTTKASTAASEDASQESTSTISYEMMNRSFHRTFPVAAELEINVEKFLIASSISDHELEPNGSLSISQVEALQESHWQAYHYLNEKKIELTRVLEAQRVEAQFALQHELMQWR
uniref:Uncharacterized protein n=1 Tax=Peronospora matthiolae TaxID=2874970 RepID=A0AAV1UIY9_9STRA